MKPKAILLLAAVAVAGYFAFRWFRRYSQRPDNWDQLTDAQQDAYNRALDRAAAYTGPTE